MRCFVVAIALFLCANRAFAAEDEITLRVQIAQNAADLFSQGQFKELNALERRYRDGERTPAGVWKLAIFYNMGLEFQPDQDSDFENNWSKIFSIAKLWVKTAPSPAAYIVLANAYLDYGRSLSEAAHDDKKLYREQSRFALQIMNSHKSDAALDPEWYATVANIAAIQHWPLDNVWALYGKAVKASPFYYDSYYQILYAMLPYWDDPAMAAFQLAGKSLLDTHQRRPEIYARIIWHAMLEGWASYEWGLDMPQMNASMIDLVNRYPDQWNIGNMAHIACSSLYMQLARSLTDRMDGEMDSVWRDQYVSYEKCKDWSHGNANHPFIKLQ